MRLVALVCLLLAACPDDNPSSPPPVTTRGYDALAYQLRARFDAERGVLVASEDITVRLTGETQQLELDSSVEVTSVRAGERDLPFQVVDGDSLAVDLAPLAPGAEPVTFTIRYEAALSSALVRTAPRDDDPVRGRVVYSNSEPDFGRLWLVAKHDPADRAHFSVELSVPAGQDAVANGRRVSDTTSGDTRTIAYDMSDPLPTYLMAFALGNLDHVERAGTPTLGLWFRKGLVTDAEAHLDMLAEQMAHFVSLLGPYPFDSYAVVLLPDFPGGMENATITFNSEDSGLGYFGYGLNAHELAHQWFGDWVTMRTYDDVWIKEGMATLLAAEAQRATRDMDDTGRLFGDDFAFFTNDKIIDRERRGFEKYTSGVYERAAWFITQRRAAMGEDNFWAAMRRVLDEHALDSVDSAAFVEALGLPASAVAGLERTDRPHMLVDIEEGGNGTRVSFSFESDTPLYTPRVTVVDAEGVAVEHELPATVDVPGGGYLALDERDVDPDWTTAYDLDFMKLGQLSSLAWPESPAAVATLLARSTAQQDLLDAAQVADDDGLADLISGLDSLPLRQQVIYIACTTIGFLRDSGDQRLAEWTAAVAPFLGDPFDPGFSFQLSGCDGAPFVAELAGLGDAQAARVEYLLSFDYGEQSLAVIGRFIDSGSLRLRDIVMTRLLDETRNLPLDQLPAEQLAAWRSFFRARLAGVTTSYRLDQVWQGLLGLDDDEGILLAAPLLHRVPDYAPNMVCSAYNHYLDEPEGFAAFRTAAEPIATLEDDVQQIFSAPQDFCGR